LADKFADISLDKKNTIVIALPRGGVPVANEIAKRLRLPLDILLVKKMGAPSYPELAIGSVSEDNEEFYNQELLSELGLKHSDIDSVKERTVNKLQEIGTLLRQGRTSLPLKNKDIILVDDGIATGASIDSAILVLKKREVRKIIIAVPVISADLIVKLTKEVDKIVALATPNPIYSVGEWYENFIQIENDEVIKILSEYAPSKKRTPLVHI
jgi:predicted phosphoribosyltransferase